MSTIGTCINCGCQYPFYAAAREKPRVRRQNNKGSSGLLVAEIDLYRFLAAHEFVLSEIARSEIARSEIARSEIARSEIARSEIARALVIESNLYETEPESQPYSPLFFLCNQHSANLRIKPNKSTLSRLHFLVNLPSQNGGSYIVRRCCESRR
jgi:hypothetical protein